MIFTSLPTALPITTNKDSSAPRTAVPIVPDNCGVYGTFYVDLSGNGLKTFNSPGRRPRMPHGNSQLHNSETVRITEPIVKTAVVREVQALPWKRALPSQPNMGVLKESWEKNYKRGELHLVISSLFSLAVGHNVFLLAFRAARGEKRPFNASTSFDCVRRSEQPSAEMQTEPIRYSLWSFKEV